jgi:hypothetical protein
VFTTTSRMVSQCLPSRRASLALTSTVALVAAAVTFAGGVQQSRAGGMPARSASVATLTPKATAFHDAMRELWEYHGTYTERAIVDYVAGNPDTNAVIATLLQNQVDIGNAAKPYYGAAGGKALTTLLTTHINDAVAVLKAAKAGDAAGTKKASAAFYANGNQIASFLHKANPRNWPLGALQTMMRIHLNQVIGLAVDQIKGKYNAAIALYESYINHLNVGMADMLSNGIIKQFPGKFS